MRSVMTFSHHSASISRILETSPQGLISSIVKRKDHMFCMKIKEITRQTYNLLWLFKKQCTFKNDMTPFHLIVFYGEVIELIMNYFSPALNPIIFHPLADLSLLCMCYFSIYLHSDWVTKCPPPPNLLDLGPSESLGP